MFRSQAVRRVTCVLAAAFGLAVFSSSARAEGLTAEDVARRATATSPEAEEKRQNVREAEAQVDKTIADFFPRLALSGSYQRLSPLTNPSIGTVAIPSLENSTTAQAQLTVPLSDYVLRIFQAHEAAKHQATASDRSLRATARKVAYDGRALYYDWVRAELEVQVAQQNVDLGKDHLTHVKTLAAADSASEADVARVEATVASSELVVVQARNLAALQRERLAILMHEPGNQRYEIGEDLKSAPGATAAAAGDIDALVAIAQRERPEVAALVEQALALESQVSVARSQALPRLDAFATGTVANPNQRRFPQEQEFRSSWAIGVQLTYAPNDTAVGLSQAAAAKARAAAAEAQRRQLLDAVRAEVTDAVLSHRNAVAGIETTGRRVAAAETSYQARRARFLADRATTVELTEAQTELFGARLEAVKAQVAIRKARARLAYVTGREGGSSW